jgi:hypothetical protein
MNPFVLLTVSGTGAFPPTADTMKVVAPVVVVRVKLSMVAVTVRLTVAVCELPPTPLSVPVMVMVCAPEGIAMLGRVEMVTVMVGEPETPPKVTEPVPLKLQVAPAGKPEQLLGVKFTVPDPVTPLAGAMVKVDEADCPAEMEVGVRVLAVNVKSGGATLTCAGESDEEALSPVSPA